MPQTLTDAHNELLGYLVAADQKLSLKKPTFLTQLHIDLTNGIQLMTVLYLLWDGYLSPTYDISGHRIGDEVTEMLGKLRQHNLLFLNDKEHVFQNKLEGENLLTASPYLKRLSKTSTKKDRQWGYFVEGVKELHQHEMKRSKVRPAPKATEAPRKQPDKVTPMYLLAVRNLQRKTPALENHVGIKFNKMYTSVKHSIYYEVEGRKRKVSMPSTSQTGSLRRASTR